MRSMNPDGSGMIDVPNITVSTYSPDGRQLVEDCGSALCTANANGSGLDDPWYGGPEAVVTSVPSWSPDQTKIIFSYNRCSSQTEPPAPACGYSSINLHYLDGPRDNTHYCFCNPPQPGDNTQPAWSPDGSKVAFTSNVDNPSPDGGYCYDACPTEIYVADPAGTFHTRLTNNAVKDQDPEWSPDSSKIAFTSYRDGNAEVYVMNADGSSQTNLTNNAAYDGGPEWSPDGTKIAFTTNRDGTYEVYKMNPDGSGPVNLSNTPSSDDGVSDWQPIIRYYARPKSAQPTLFKLVPAYKPCTSPNGTHGAPLAAGSCSPAVPASDYLTVGTPDANGAATQATGSGKIEGFCNPPAPNLYAPCTDPGDQADISLTLTFTDVRKKSDLTDYTGQLQFRSVLRLTDRLNGCCGNGGPYPATVTDFPFTFAVPCSSTGAMSVGSTCSISTSSDALLENMANESKRQVWELGQIQVYDGGSDGVAATPGNTLFATQGLYAP
jgi:Tol biopolymer transport system component